MPRRHYSKSGYFDFSKQSVLVVEDHLASRRMVSEVLRGLGCRSVFACGDTRSALDTIRWQRVDLAIIDIALDGEDGVDFVRQLRASATPGLAKLAILVVSPSPPRQRSWRPARRGLMAS